MRISSEAMSLTVPPVTFVDISVFLHQPSFAIRFVILPVANVLSAVRSVLNASSVLLSVCSPFSFILALINELDFFFFDNNNPVIDVFIPLEGAESFFDHEARPLGDFGDSFYVLVTLLESLLVNCVVGVFEFRARKNDQERAFYQIYFPWVFQHSTLIAFWPS